MVVGKLQLRVDVTLDTFLSRADDYLDACLRHMVLGSSGYSKVQVYIVSSGFFVMILKMEKLSCLGLEWFLCSIVVRNIKMIILV